MVGGGVTVLTVVGIALFMMMKKPKKKPTTPVA